MLPFSAYYSPQVGGVAGVAATIYNTPPPQVVGGTVFIVCTVCTVHCVYYALCVLCIVYTVHCLYCALVYCALYVIFVLSTMYFKLRTVPKSFE